MKTITETKIVSQTMQKNWKLTNYKNQIFFFPSLKDVLRKNVNLYFLNLFVFRQGFTR
jgi:hypothetical protein